MDFLNTTGDPINVATYDLNTMKERIEIFKSQYIDVNGSILARMQSIVNYIENNQTIYQGIKVYVSILDHEMKDTNSSHKNNPMQSNNFKTKKMQENDTKDQPMLDSFVEKSKSQNQKIVDSKCRFWIICWEKKKIKKRTSLGLYTGRRIKNRKLDKYYPKTNLAPHAICESRRKNAHCINANYSTDSAPQYANDIMSKKSQTWT